MNDVYLKKIENSSKNFSCDTIYATCCPLCTEFCKDMATIFIPSSMLSNEDEKWVQRVELLEFEWSMFDIIIKNELEE